MMKKQPILYLFHFLGNSDLKFKKEIPEEYRKKLNLTEDRNNKEYLVIKPSFFREATKTILDNIEEYKKYLVFDIIENELQLIKKKFPNHQIKFVFIYTNQINSNHSKKDTIFLFEIIKKLNIVDIEESIEIKEGNNEFSIFNKIVSFIKEKENNRKSRLDYIFFTSAGLPHLKVIGSFLTFLNSIYTSSLFLRAEIDEYNNLKFLNKEIFKSLFNAFMEKNFLEALEWSYNYLPIIRNLNYIEKDKKIKETIENLDKVISYLYKRILRNFFKDKKELQKLISYLKDKKLYSKEDVLFNNSLKEKEKILLSKIQDFHLYIEENKIKEAVLLSTVIFDLLKELIGDDLKTIKLKSNKLYILRNKNELKAINLNADNFYSLLPYLYESNHLIKNLIFGNDKIIKVEENKSCIIFEDLLSGLRKQRNELAHKGFFEGDPKKLLSKLDNIYIQLYEVLLNNKFKNPFYDYKNTICKLIEQLQ
ncbi:MAG: hypothetical protein ABGW69_02480 [Nanoarchaeota archaeon]